MILLVWRTQSGDLLDFLIDNLASLLGKLNLLKFFRQILHLLTGAASHTTKTTHEITKTWASSKAPGIDTLGCLVRDDSWGRASIAMPLQVRILLLDLLLHLILSWKLITSISRLILLITLPILFSKLSHSSKLYLCILFVRFRREHPIKHSLEGDVVYLISLDFFFAVKVVESPPLGNSHNSMAFCWRSLTLSESL